MKNILRSLILLVCLLETVSVFAQSPKRLEWIKDNGSDGQYETIFSTAKTSTGEVVVTSRSWSGETLRTKDIFKVQKYNTKGILLWERKITDSLSEQNILPGGLCVDHNDNVYVLVNTFSRKLLLDSLIISCPNHESTILKFTSNGALSWFSQLNTLTKGWAMEDNTSMLTIDNNNDLIVTGPAQSNDSTFKIDGVAYFTTPFYGAYFLAKYSPEGKVRWAKSMISNVKEYSNNEYFSSGMFIKVDSSNSIFVLGYFAGELTMDEVSVSALGPIDMFLSKVSPDGAVRWIRSIGGNDPKYGERPWGLVLDNDQCPYIIGNVPPVLKISGWQDSSIGYQKDEMFICKFTTNGTVVWTDRASGLDYRRLGSTVNDCPMSIEFSGFDNSIFVRAHLFQDAKIKDTTIIIDQENGCPVLWSYDLTGSLKWLHTFPYQYGYLQFNSISATDQGDIYLGGYAGTYFDYKPEQLLVSLEDTSFHTNGFEDGVLAKLSLRPTSSVYSSSAVVLSSAIYPNPATTSTSIEIPTEYAQSVVTCTVYTVLGQKVMEHQAKVANGILTFERGNLSGGVYTIRIFDGNVIILESQVVFQ